MKRCPECRRDYYDDSLLYCLDDGSALLEGPANADEPATAILSEPPALAGGRPGSEASTRQHIRTVAAEDESRQGLDNPRVRQNFSAYRAAKPLGALIAAAVILVGGFFGYKYFSSTHSGQIESIAVMPFVNESGNPDVEYLSDGMTETLISALSQLPGVSVKARSSVFRYKGRSADPHTIGSELNVQAVLNGRVVQHGDQLTLSLELVNAATENAIWSEQYNRKASDLISLQTEIARDVANKLRTRLSGADEQKLAKTYTTNPEAYRLYLQGRFYWNQREEKQFNKAVDYYTRAISLDPNYALAYAGLADTYALLSTFGFTSSEDGIQKARQYAARASSLDSTLAEPHTTLAYILIDHDYDLVAAELEFTRAIELDPKYATAHQWYAEMLSYDGRFDEASAEFDRAFALEPLSVPINWDYARFLYNCRRYDESIAQAKKTMELDPYFARIHRTVADVYLMKGDLANAAEERAISLDLAGQPELAKLLRDAVARSGWAGYVRSLTSDNSPFKEGNFEWLLAKTYAQLRDNDKAFAELNSAYDKRLSSVCWLKVEPQLDPLRADPRYAEFIKRVGF